MKSITFQAVMVGTAFVSGYLNKYYTATILNLFYSTVLENGSRISILHCKNSHRLDMLHYSVAGLLIALANLWQISHTSSQILQFLSSL